LQLIINSFQFKDLLIQKSLIKKIKIQNLQVTSKNPKKSK